MTTYRNESLPRLAYLYAKASIDQDAATMNAIASELRRKDEAVARLVEAARKFPCPSCGTFILNPKPEPQLECFCDDIRAALAELEGHNA